ncbi:hypothetical protein [Georgenia faecalis]|uniref:Integral membrane protein n=1 Tax=Georgenia faecalis TaxID=2483799 RepID=A0ABV9DAK0_9MICO|nr:hypothetical protein [Georgenia faecalis]
MAPRAYAVVTVLTALFGAALALLALLVLWLISREDADSPRPDASAFDLTEAFVVLASQVLAAAVVLVPAAVAARMGYGVGRYVTVLVAALLAWRAVGLAAVFPLLAVGAAWWTFAVVILLQPPAQTFCRTMRDYRAAGRTDRALTEPARR